MSAANLRDAVVERVWSAYAGRSSAQAPRRPRHRQVIAQVTAVRDLAPGLRRITLRAPDLTGWRPVGPDEYVGLLMPRPGVALELPDPARRDVRAALTDVPEAVRPDLRWYTVAEYREESAEMDVDIVLHGDAGPGSAWACRVECGETVGVRTSGACYAPPSPTARQLLVADETALPALAAIVRSWAQIPPVRIHVEVPDLRFLHAYDAAFSRVTEPRPGALVVHDRGTADPGATLVPALMTATPTTPTTPAAPAAPAAPATPTTPTAPAAPAAPGELDLDYAWLCGESTTVTTLRRHLVAQGVDRRRIFFSGYWKQGAARG